MNASSVVNIKQLLNMVALINRRLSANKKTDIEYNA